MPKNSILNKNNQDIEVLEDKSSSGKVRPWREKKLKSLELSGSYERLKLENKFLDVRRCGETLVFKKFADGTKNLDNVYFCKKRLCSVCAWRRELKIFSQVSQVVSSVDSGNTYKFLFLTLTCKNVSSDKLSDEIDNLIKSFDRMFKRKTVKDSIKGWFRALEITHDVNKKITKEMYYGCEKKHLKSRKGYYDNLGLEVGDDNPNFDMYHPHFHVILLVNKNYFAKNYVNQEEWTSLWQESLRCDYIPRVHIEAFKNKNNKGIAEAAKYTVKDSDYLVKDDPDLTDKAVITLDSALHHRRLVAFGGVLKDEHKQLKLEDLNNKDADLIHIDGEEISEKLNFVLDRYRWNVGYSNYVKF